MIVSGWRGATVDRHGEVVSEALYPIQLTYEPGEVTLVHGKCPYGGIDLIAEKVVQQWGWNVERHPPEMRGGRILGSPRNRHMCSLGADELVAFPGPGSTGTWDCMRWAARFGIPFRAVPLGVGAERVSAAAGDVVELEG